MSQLSRRRVRMKCDTAKFDAIIDALTNSQGKIWNGSPARFEIGLFYGNTLITDLSLLIELTLQIKAASNGGAPAEAAAVLATKTVDTFDATLDAATWADGSKQHAVFTFTGAELKLGPGDYWFILVGTITGESEPITYAAGLFKIVADGYENGAGSAPDPVESYLNTAQSDARYGRKGLGSPDWRLDITGHTGDAATDLDSLDTATLTLGYLIFINHAAGLQGWVLTEGTPAEDVDAGIILPHDHAAETNEKYWNRRF